MDEERRFPEPKISVPVAIGGLILYGIFDAADALVPGLGDVLDAIDGILVFAMGMAGYGTVIVVDNLVGLGLEAIPFVQALPLYFICWVIAIILDRYPQILPERIQKMLIKAAAVESLAEGNIGAAEKGLASEGEAVEATIAAQAEQAAVAEESAQAVQAAEATEAAAGTEVSVEAGEGEGGGKEDKRHPVLEAYDRFRSMPGGGAEEEDEEGGEGGGEEEISPEDQEMKEILEGDYVGRSLRENLGAEELLSRIPTNDNRYNRDVDLRN